MQMDAWLTETRSFLAQIWSWLREVSGDDAYDYYRATAGHDRTQPQLTAADFYLQRLERKYSRPSRCC